MHSPPSHDLLDRRFGYLTVEDHAEGPGEPARRGLRWLCRCDCGDAQVIEADRLRSGEAEACHGCLRPEFAATDHGSLPGEEWRRVEPGGGRYEVSSLGRVARRSCLSGSGRFVLAINRATNVPSIGLAFDGPQKTRSLARLVALAFLPPPPDPSYIVVPRNGVRGDLRADNLEWARSRFVRGRKPKSGTAIADRDDSPADLPGAALAHCLRQMVDADGRSRAAIGRACNPPMGQAQVSSFLSGVKPVDPPLSTLTRIAGALGYEIELRFKTTTSTVPRLGLARNDPGHPLVEDGPGQP